jgi:hypothetical protein
MGPVDNAIFGGMVGAFIGRIYGLTGTTIVGGMVVGSGGTALLGGSIVGSILGSVLGVILCTALSGGY